MEKGSRKATTRLVDVAERAGVSVATASKALHDNPRISARTKNHVQKIANELAYTPNKLAQSLVSGLTGTVGLVTSDMQGRFSTQILIGAENTLEAQSFSILLTNARGDPSLEKLQIRKLLSLKVDGLILMGRETDPRASLGSDFNLPLVYAYAPSRENDDASITCDNGNAGKIAVDHLLSCGRRKIAIIGGDGTYAAARDRAKGSLTALKEAGLKPAGPLRFGRWDGSWGRGATRLLLDQDVDFDAVVCQNDQIARGCIDVLKERGIRIPEDVAVIGHDNWSELVDISRPELTSIDNNAVEIGSQAAQMLLDAIGGKPHHSVRYIPCRLIQRGSTVQLD